MNGAPREQRTGNYVKTALMELFLRGAPQTIRTSDLSLRRGALYPAELGVRISL